MTATGRPSLPPVSPGRQMPDASPADAVVRAAERSRWRAAAGRLWSTVLAAWAVIAGVTPHVLHHVGPLAGVALVSGVGGTVLFGGIGFVATIPLLLRLRRRFGSWTVPGLALALFVTVFTVSTVVVGPQLTSAEDSGSRPASEIEHEEHHS